MMDGLLIWARGNPILARVGLRFVARLAIAMVLVLPLQAVGAQMGVSPNFGAIGAVIIGLWVGGRWANRQADRWDIPPEHAP
jgi:hypothetical protein